MKLTLSIKEISIISCTIKKKIMYKPFQFKIHKIQQKQIVNFKIL
jgi:hypothetical protein